VQGDLVTALLAQELLREFPGSKVHADVRSSWSVEEVVKESGGEFSMCRVGHAMIKQLMRQTQAIFAGELSMHFYFRELGNFESGDYVMLLVLRQLARTGKTFSELIAPLRRYAKSPELNFEVTDPQKKIQALKEFYSAQASAVIELDGIRCEFRAGSDRAADWWFNVRASNTEPLIRLNLEAATPAVLAQKLTELTDFIRL
jgi:phosphomannomutase